MTVDALLNAPFTSIQWANKFVDQLIEVDQSRRLFPCTLEKNIE